MMLKNYRSSILILVIIALFALLSFSIIRLFRDASDLIRPDIEVLHEFGRPATVLGKRERLGNSSFYAVSGPARYDDSTGKNWDYFTIKVVESRGTIWHLLNEARLEEADYVLFRRDIKFNEKIHFDEDFSEGQFTRPMISYDKKIGKVTFIFFGDVYEYQIPRG